MNIAGKGLVSGIHQEFLYKSVRNSFLKMHKGFEEVLHKEKIKMTN